MRNTAHTTDRTIARLAAKRTRRLWTDFRSYPGPAESPSESALGCMTGVTNLRRR